MLAHGFLKQQLQSIDLCMQDWHDALLARIISHVFLMCGNCSYSSEGQQLPVKACKLACRALIGINITAWSDADIVC